MFYHFYKLLNCRLIKEKQTEITTYRHKAKIIKQETVSYFRFHKVVAVCLDNSFAYYGQYLNQLH